MRAERRTVECTTGGVRLLGGRRTDRGLVLVPQVRGWGSGRQDSDYGSGASVESSKQCPGRGKTPSQPGPEDRHEPLLVLARRPRTSQSECSPAHQALNLSRLHGFMPVLLWFRGRVEWSRWSKRACPAFSERFHSFRWSSRVSTLTFAFTLYSTARENPEETMHFLAGLRRFDFCGLQVVVFALRNCSAGFSPALGP